MRPPHVLFVLAAVFVLVVAFVPAGSAAPPPEGVCGVCGDDFEWTADENGVNASVDESSLGIRVTADGDSQWRATATLNRTAATQFEENQTALERTVTQTYSRSRILEGEPENLSATLEDRTLTVTFAVDDATHQYPGGVIVFDEFTQSPPTTDVYVNADTLTITGPSGTTVTHAPPGGTSTENQATWTSDTDQQYDGPELGRDATVAFAPDDGLVSKAATSGALEAHSFGLIESDLREFAALPTGLLGLVAAGLLLAGNRLPRTFSRGRTITRWLGVGAGLYAAFAVLAAVTAGDFWIIFAIIGIALAPQTFLTAVAAILTDFVNVNTDRNVSRIAAVAALAWTGALVVGAPLSANLVFFAGPLIFLPFGVLAGAKHPARFLFPFIAALGPIVAGLALVPQIGIVLVTPTMFAGILLGTALLGVPLFAIGRRFGRNATTATERTDTPAGTAS
ncbi:hypothetical protein HALLA_19375 [Halostagnicola larsenii XH-48]|uniref:Uncharacterized protein n=1 Tax=Halostagnicola larsenii XH-48 TaxID=797299 RepID=W0JV12_9EURY|nr:MFS transporter [Halostagnicola larsenii]AHG01192.1 hypothetical protein HALLA_19375 [Halostagnicola larsenii XH-48]